MSVASSSGGLSGWAETITPDSACTALRVEATRTAPCSWFRKSEQGRVSFICVYERYREVHRGCGYVESQYYAGI